MKRHTTILICILSVILCSKTDMSRAQARRTFQPLSGDSVYLQGFQAQFGNVEVSNDSLTISFSVELYQPAVVADVTLSITPVLFDETHRVNLPPVIVNGPNRTAYYRREREFDYNRRLPIPYTVINLTRKRMKQPGLSYIEYQYKLPFALWMGNASLSLRVIGRDCCNEYPLGNKLLCADLRQSIPANTDTLYVYKENYLYKDTCLCEIIEKPEQETHNVSPQLLPAPFIEDEPSLTFRLWFKQNEYKVHTELYENDKQIEQMRAAFMRLGNRLLAVKVTSYSSPEGLFLNNQALAQSRGQIVNNFLLKALPLLPAGKIEHLERSENWEGLEWLLQHSDSSYCDEALRIIREVPIFKFRETRLMELHRGNPYREMLKELFPLLRYADITFIYEENLDEENEQELMLCGEEDKR